MHLDRIRYPEISIAGQTPASGTSVGYNATSIARFQPRHAVISDQPAAIPALPWKTNPQVGHLRGSIRDEAGVLVDTGTVTIQRDGDGTTPVAGRTAVSTASDGNGYYGGVDLAPGRFRVTVQPVGQAAFTTVCTAAVTTGQVATFDIRIYRTAPTGTLTASPGAMWPPTDQMATVTLSGTVSDLGTGIASVTFRVVDEYGLVEPSVEPVSANGETTLKLSRTLELQASRRGGDLDGRTYTIEAIVTDRACNVTTLRTTVVVLHDRR